MLKIFTFRKIAITTLLLVLGVILYNYPEQINQSINEDIKNDEINIYLIDRNYFVAMTKIDSNAKTNYEMIDEILDTLLNNEKVPDGFSSVFPSGTKVINYSLDEDLLKIDFTKEFLNIKLKDEEKMIESLIYSLTSIEGINKIMIFVEGEKLNELPNSKKKLGLYLDRNYGINKVINITSLDDSKMVTVYYFNNEDDNKYYVPVSYIVNDNNDKIEIIIKNLKSNNLNSSNLSSYLDYQVELMNYESNESYFLLNFNEYLLSSVYDGKLQEEVKYAFFYSIYDTFGVDKVVFEVNSQKIDEFGLAK